MWRYVLAARVTMAQNLRSTLVPVGEIARRLGLLDAQQVDQRFRRVAGCSPGTFRLRGGVRLR